MKKLFLVATVLLLGCITLLAQRIVDFRIEGGPSINIIQGQRTFNDNIVTAHSNIGYHAGAYVDVRLYKGFFLGSGLTFAQKGIAIKSSLRFTSEDLATILPEILDKLPDKVKNSEEEVNANMASKINMHYLQIPLNIGYKFDLGKKFWMALQTGPYFALVINKSNKTEVEVETEIQDNKEKLAVDLFKDSIHGYGPLNPKKFDIGWHLALMGAYSSFYITTGVGLDFLNILQGERGKKSGKEFQKVLYLNKANLYVALGISF